MRKSLTTTVLVAALTAVPLVGLAATPATRPAQAAAKHAAAKPAAAKPATAKPAATHATRGVVKSLDATTLVITRAGAKDKKPNGSEMTFALNPQTHREGSVEVGKPVSVRYREEGKTHVALVIAAERAKQQAAHKASSLR